MTYPKIKARPVLRQLRLSIQTCIGGIFMLLLMPAVADAQAADSLRQTVIAFLQQQTANHAEQDIEINVGRIDRRLKLATCDTPPTAFLPAGAKLQGRLTVGLRCTGLKSWTVYIPAQIKVFANVIAAAHPLSRGRKITAVDLMTTRKEIGQIHNGYFTNNETLFGKIITQNIAAGHTITPQRIKSPILVHRGEKVAIIASVGTLKVRGKGEALRDAAEGELVSVRNSRSKRIVQGIVTHPGTVKIQM